MDTTQPLQTRPCVGCGHCCRTAPCVAAVRIYGNGINTTGCPALFHRDKRWWCKIVDHARGPLREQFVAELAIGAGCCSGLNTDRNRIPTPEGVARRNSGKPRIRKAKPNPSTEVDWQKAFKFLSASLGGHMVSGDLIYLIARSMEKAHGPRVTLEFLTVIRSRRSREMDEFMGEIPNPIENP